MSLISWKKHPNKQTRKGFLGSVAEFRLILLTLGKCQHIYLPPPEKKNVCMFLWRFINSSGCYRSHLDERFCYSKCLDTCRFSISFSRVDVETAVKGIGRAMPVLQIDLGIWDENLIHCKSVRGFGEQPVHSCEQGEVFSWKVCHQCRRYHYSPARYCPDIWDTVNIWRSLYKQLVSLKAIKKLNGDKPQTWLLLHFIHIQLVSSTGEYVWFCPKSC